MAHKQTNHQDALQPFLAALDGTPVPRAELVAGGRKIAQVLIAYGRPVTLCADDHWAGVWDLERLTDDEAVFWGFWVAMKAGPPPGRGPTTKGTPE